MTNVPMNPEEIHTLIDGLQRTPFRNILAEYLQCAPSMEAIQEFANDYPDRYARAIKDLSQLAGYQEKVSHEHNYLIAIGQMPDSAIAARMKELEEKLSKEPIDVVPEPPA